MADDGCGNSRGVNVWLSRLYYTLQLYGRRSKVASALNIERIEVCLYTKARIFEIVVETQNVSQQPMLKANNVHIVILVCIHSFHTRTLTWLYALAFGETHLYSTLFK